MQVMGLALPSFYRPLALTRETYSGREAALARYRSTAGHIYGVWYRGRPWEPGSPAARSLHIVNSIHRYHTAVLC